MGTNTTPKKPAATDWHPADIVAELRKAGWSLRRLSSHYGYSDPTSLAKALSRPWPLAERRIADAIGVPPEQIWPSRYEDTTRKRVKSGRSEAA